MPRMSSAGRRPNSPSAAPERHRPKPRRSQPSRPTRQPRCPQRAQRARTSGITGTSRAAASRNPITTAPGGCRSACCRSGRGRSLSQPAAIDEPQSRGIPRLARLLSKCGQCARELGLGQRDHARRSGGAARARAHDHHARSSARWCAPPRTCGAAEPRRQASAGASRRGRGRRARPPRRSPMRWGRSHRQARQQWIRTRRRLPRRSRRGVRRSVSPA